MRISIVTTFLIGTILLAGFTTDSKKIENRSVEIKYDFYDSTILVRAKFIRVSISACKCFVAIPERNTFELQESGPGILVYTKKQIEIEYGYDDMNFRVGSSYYIKAKKIPNSKYYKSLYTSPFPSKDWYLKNQE